MINENKVYKIKYIALTDREKRIHFDKAWVHGFNVTPKLGGSGKTFTSKKIVNKMFNSIKSSRKYGIEFTCEIVTFDLIEVESSSEIV